LKSYSTAAATRSARLTYWNDIHWSTFAPLEFKPVDRDTFDAAFSIDALGPISFARTYAHPAAIIHTEKHVKLTHERRVFLGMPIEGRVRSCHYGHDVLLEEGDFVLSDYSAPSRTLLMGPNYSYGLSFSYDTLIRFIPSPEAIFGRRVCGSDGLGHTVGALVRSLWTQVERGVPTHFGPGLAKNVLEVVAAAYAMQYAAEVAECSVASGRRGQIKRFIETHLREADLTATAVADGLGISPRYVRMVFSAEKESVLDYILRRRLEESAMQLTSAPLASRSITDVAFECGFSSMAHFTRSFKKRYGMTPSEYKRSSGAPPKHSATT
jgi:AraC-like DNA-binding protein